MVGNKLLQPRNPRDLFSPAAANEKGTFDKLLDLARDIPAHIPKARLIKHCCNDDRLSLIDEVTKIFEITNLAVLFRKNKKKNSSMPNLAYCHLSDQKFNTF